MKTSSLQPYKCVSIVPIWQGPLSVKDTCIHGIYIQNTTPNIELDPLKFRDLSLNSFCQKTQDFELIGLPIWLTGLEFLTLKISLTIFRKEGRKSFFQEKILNIDFSNIRKIIANEKSYLLVFSANEKLTLLHSEVLHLNQIPHKSLKTSNPSQKHKKIQP